MDSTRRSFLIKILAGVNAAFAALMGVPVLGYLSTALFKKKQLHWAEAGPVESFQGGIPKSARLRYTNEEGFRPIEQARNVWIRLEGDQLVVFSNKCTHLGCNVNWVKEKSHFFCPCHDGEFDRDGKVLAGPPPAPLNRLEAKIENGRIFVAV